MSKNLYLHKVKTNHQRLGQKNQGGQKMYDIEITKELAREFALEIFDCIVQELQAMVEENTDCNNAAALLTKNEI